MLALLELTLTSACSRTFQQQWITAKFAECTSIMNAPDIKLSDVSPNGSWSATVHSHGDYDRLAACMADEKVSAGLYRRYADDGNGAAMALLGRMYEDGRGGLTQDDMEAVQWYRRGAQAGNGAAMASLGYMYEKGRGGLAQNIGEAKQWYRRGADTGDHFAMYYMGRAYEFGVGVNPDRDAAAKWYRKSAAAGFTPAADRLKKLGD